MKTLSLILLAMLLTACAPAAIATQPSAATETAMPSIPPGYEEGPIFINSSELLVAESYPVQVHLHITGDLPTPCNRFRADVAAPNSENQIHVRAYTVVNPDMMCTQALEPFDENVAIPMDGAADGFYSVWLNGELVGEFSYPG
jgi:inhibitor of cysteine peptidase